MPDSSTFSSLDKKRAAITKWYVLSVAMLSCCTPFANDAILPVIPLLTEAFGIEAGFAQYSLIACIAGLGLGQVPLGVACDRYGRRPVGFFCILLLVIASSVSLFAPSITLVLLGRFVTGIAIAGFPVVSNAILRDISDGHDDMGRYLAIITVFTGMFTVISPIITSLLMAYVGWRAAFLSVLVYALIAGGLFLRLVPEPQSERRSADKISEQLNESLHAFIGSPNTLFSTVMISLYFAGYFCIISTTPSILVDVYDKPATLFAWLFALVAIGNGLGGIVCRKLIGWGVFKLLGLATLISGICAIAFLGMFISRAPLYVFWFFITLYGLGVGIAMTTAVAIALDPLPETAGFAASFMGAIQVLFGAIISGVVASHYIGSSGLLLLVLFGLGALMCAFYMIFTCRSKQNDSVDAKQKN